MMKKPQVRQCMRHNFIEKSYVVELSEEEEIEIIYYHDYFNAENSIVVQWYTKAIPKSLIKIFTEKMKDKTRKQIRSEVSKFIRLLGLREYFREYLYYFTVDLSGREVRMLMRLFKLASSIEELISLILFAFIAMKSQSNSLIIRYIAIDEDLELPTIYCEDESFFKAVQIFNHLFAKHLHVLRERYMRYFMTGAHKNEQFESILKLHRLRKMWSRNVRVIYDDGYIVFRIEYEKDVYPIEREYPLTIECYEHDFDDLIRLKPEDQKKFISLLTSLCSVREAVAMFGMLHFISFVRRAQKILEIPCIELVDHKQIIQDYVKSLDKCYKMLTTKAYDEEVLQLALSERLKYWKEVFDFINSYGDRQMAEQYIFIIAVIAIKLNQSDIFKQISKYLDEKQRVMLKLKFLSL